MSALQSSVATGLDSADAASTRLAVVAAQAQVYSLSDLFLLRTPYSEAAIPPAD